MDQVFRAGDFAFWTWFRIYPRIDAVHPGACSLYAFSNEAPFIISPMNATSLTTRLLNPGNMNDVYLHTLLRNFLVPNVIVLHTKLKLRNCRCDESIHLSEGQLSKHRVIEARIGRKCPQ
jgi:hypothetical protein